MKVAPADNTKTSNIIIIPRKEKQHKACFIYQQDQWIEISIGLKGLCWHKQSGLVGGLIMTLYCNMEFIVNVDNT